MTEQLFHEIYGTYFSIVKYILNQQQPLTAKKLEIITRNQGFRDSFLQLLPSIQNKRNPWYLCVEKEPAIWYPVTKNHSPIIHTNLERRWLKTLLTDTRLSFFLEDKDIIALEQQLGDTQPLFDLKSVTYYDQFKQNNFLLEQQKHFKQLLHAINVQEPVKIDYQRRKNTPSTRGLFLPVKLEYSPKNNLFRLKAWRLLRRSRFEVTLNLNRMLAVQLVEKKQDYSQLPIISREKKAEIVCTLVDQRKALARSMLHFADYRKTTRRLDDTHYELTIQYNRGDETELLIRILSFGPFLKVVHPDTFIVKIKERITAQAKLMETLES